MLNVQPQPRNHPYWLYWGVPSRQLSSQLHVLLIRQTFHSPHSNHTVIQHPYHHQNRRTASHCIRQLTIQSEILRGSRQFNQPPRKTSTHRSSRPSTMMCVREPPREQHRNQPRDKCQHRMHTETRCEILLVPTPWPRDCSSSSIDPFGPFWSRPLGHVITAPLPSIPFAIPLGHVITSRSQL